MKKIMQKRPAGEVDAKVDEMMGRLTLEEKVGACLTQSWRGSIITPSVVELIEKLHTGGLRIEPYTTESANRLSYGRKIETVNFKARDDYFEITETYWKQKHPGFNLPAKEYAKRLNRIKEIAMNRRSGLPLHICTDFEGDFSHDFPFGGIQMFPANMGLRATGNVENAYEVAYATGRQLAAIGVNMLHSPVMDVNVNPDNPEINIRAFSDDPDVYCDWAVAYMRGLEDGGVVATAKHFPGRGDSSVDAHHDLPVLDSDRERLDAIEAKPYRAAIQAGLRAIMAAHNAYTALDERDMPATLSAKILTGFLREELGFKGVITTDAMGMGAVVQKWGVPVASAMSLKAGSNLILLKFDDALRSQTFHEILNWVRDGKLAEEELDDRVIPVLRMKAEQGLFDDGGQVDTGEASEVFSSGDFRTLSRSVADECVSVLYDKQNILPLDGSASKVLLIEQIIIPEFLPENAHYHAHSFSEAMLEHSLNAINMDTEFSATEQEVELALALAEKSDVVVMTNYYWRIIPENNTHLVRALREAGKKVIVVTNNPYPMGSTPEADAVICTYGVVPNCLEAAAGVIYGKQQPAGQWPLENYRHPEMTG